MSNVYYYGLTFRNSFADEFLFAKLAKAMFFSQSCEPKYVNQILNKFEQLEILNIVDYISTLEKEAREIASNCEEFPYFYSQAVANLQVWINNFGCTFNEIQEYIDFFKIPDEFAFELEVLKPDKYSYPVAIKSEIDRFVIGQEQAKKIVSVAVYTHLLRINRTSPKIAMLYKQKLKFDDLTLPNPNLMLIGSTGTGKSFLLKTIAKCYDIPFFKIDCSILVASGYVGNTLNDLLYSFYSYCEDYDLDMSKSILFFDEFDKLSEKTIGRDGSVGGIEMQQEFLNLIEDRYVKLNAPRGQERSFVRAYLGNCLFVFGGAFDGINKIVDKRLKANKTIGYNTPANLSKSDKQQVKHDDIVKYGIIPELVGRINHIVQLDDHTEETIVTILRDSEDSPLINYRNYFSIHLDRLIIKEDVYNLIAKEVIKRNTGARAINTVLNELLEDLLYEKPNLVKEDIVIDREYFEGVFGNNK